MALTVPHTQSLKTYFEPIVGQTAWNVTIGQGSFITMEFGEPGANGHGTWHFWVYCCAWRIETHDDVLAYSKDDRSRLIQVIKSFEGKALERVEIDFPHGDTKLWFEGSLMLRLIPIHAETYEHWLLYTPTGTLIFGPGTEWQFEAETLKTATL